MNFMHSTKAYILPASIERVRMQIFRKQISKYGGRIHEVISSDTTHLIVDDSMPPVVANVKSTNNSSDC